jgi:FkbM family methyltransferase
MHRAVYIVNHPIQRQASLLRRIASGCIPRRLRLPLRFWWARCKQTLEPELIFVSKQDWRSGIAVDVGAGHGMYSYALAKVFDRVEAFEPNLRNAADLYSMRSGKIVIRGEALSDRVGESILHIPVSSRGVEYGGLGTLHQETLPPADQVRVYEITTRTLDSYDFENVVFIKIDVETHERQVLDGAGSTIERCRPTFLIEVKPPARAEVWNFFLARDYRCFFLERNRLCSVTLVADFAANSGENFFWLPAESVGISGQPGVVSVNKTSTWPNE